MNHHFSLSLAVASIGIAMLAVNNALGDGKGLYADDTKDQTTGDLKDQDYWWAMWDSKMLEDAIKSRQPEGRIGVDLASSIRRLDELEKKYPKHDGIKAMKKRATEVAAKIDPNANRGDSYKPGFPWGMANFEQAWVNFHWGKMLADANDVQQAAGLYQNVVQNLTLIADRPEIFGKMPEEYVKWAADNKPVAEKMLADLKKRL